MKELKLPSVGKKEGPEEDGLPAGQRKPYKTPRLYNMGSMVAKTKGPNTLLGGDFLVLGGS